MRILGLRRLGMATLLALSVYGQAGCAEERAPINRVQPNLLPKSFFVGADLQDPKDDPEFWARGTVTDVGYGAHADGLFTSTYAQPVTRIKWEITEDKLVGRVAYERIQDSDHKGVGNARPDGIVAYVYAISSHFDVRRDYNATTGEEANTVVENTTDRPWYQRDYMRVDWSKNLSTDNYDFDTLSMLGIFGGVKYEPTAYQVQDPADPNYPMFDVDGGYFDVTNKAFAAPQTIDLSRLGWGMKEFPACMLPPEIGGGGEPVAQCSPVELTIRQSFRRIEPFDYEAKDWDGYRFQAFGAFTTDRRGYDRSYGVLDDKWHRFVSRYNIYERDHFYAADWNNKNYKKASKMDGAIACNTADTGGGAGADYNFDGDHDGTADVCAGVTAATGFGGSQCDPYAHACTLPFQARVAKPIQWYTSVTSNLDYFEGTDWATHEWDVAMRSAVISAKYTECKRTKGGDCDGLYPMYHGQQEDNDDAIALAQEVDDCRNHKGHVELNGDEAACTAIADDIGGQRGYSPGVIAVAKMPEQVVLCHSPVELNDAASCAPADKRLPKNVTAADCQVAVTSRDLAKLDVCNKSLVVRTGDLRYHQVNLIKQPQEPSAWGIMTDSDDPLTGMKIGASINVWTNINDLWSQGLVDQLRYIKHELSTEDITNGANIRDWVSAANATYSGGQKLEHDDVIERVATASGNATIKKVADLPKLSPQVIRKGNELAKQLQGVRADAQAVSVMQPIYEARRQMAVDTPLEATLMTKSMQEYAGVSKLGAGAATQLGSYLRGANPMVQRDLRRMRDLAMEQRGMCVMADAPAPLGNEALASILEQKFGKFASAPCKATDSKCKSDQAAHASPMKAWLAQRVNYAVIIHEMGHSIGLRHNFISSADSFNYRPQYWQLRTKNGSVTKTCAKLSEGGKDCVGPRYIDPVDKEENDNLIWMWMQSSVMDYAGEPTQDMLGLGAYDFAAARMFYGDTVSVYSGKSLDKSSDAGQGLFSKMDTFGGILGLQYEVGQQPTQADPSATRRIHYSELQNNYKLINGCQNVNPANFRPSNWDEQKSGTWSPILDGRMVKANGQWSRCKSQPVDYATWSDLRMPAAGDFRGDSAAQASAAQNYRGGPSVLSQTGKVRVPYGFATDRWADLGNLSVYRHDNGADAYELFTFLQAQPEVQHIFSDYRRGRSTFSVAGAASRYLTRYNEKIRDGAKGLALYMNIYKQFATEIGVNFDDLWMYFAGSQFKEPLLASTMAFDAFSRQMARPESGDHFLDVDGVYRSTADRFSQIDAKAPRALIPDGATGFFGNVAFGGKLLENQLSRDRGEYDSEYTLNVGSYYDKVFSTMLLTESVDNFISSSRGDFLDARYRSVSMADLFSDGYRRWVANNLTGDDFIKGVRVPADASERASVDEIGFVTNIGWTNWWNVQGPQACFTGAGTTACGFFNGDQSTLQPTLPVKTAVLDPQVGWEQQKFLIVNTLMYLPENQKLNWLDQLRIYELGTDSDPGFPNRIVLNAPNGRVYIAQTNGTEAVFGKTVQKNIGARVLEYADELLAKGYATTEVKDAGGKVIGHQLKRDAKGNAVVLYDPNFQGINTDGTNKSDGCNETDNSKCTCASNLSCVKLNDYISVPEYLRQAVTTFRMNGAHMKGVY